MLSFEVIIVKLFFINWSRLTYSQPVTHAVMQEQTMSSSTWFYQLFILQFFNFLVIQSANYNILYIYSDLQIGPFHRSSSGQERKSISETKTCLLWSLEYHKTKTRSLNHKSLVLIQILIYRSSSLAKLPKFARASTPNQDKGTICNRGHSSLDSH